MIKSRTLKIVFISIVTIVLATTYFIYKKGREENQYTSTKAQEDIQFKKGEELFVQNCMACHCVDMKKRSTAPPLGGVTKKRDKRWLYGYTRNANNIIFRNDPIKKEGWALMTSFPNLTNNEIDAIYYFVEKRYQMTLNGVPAKKYFSFDEKENNMAKVCTHVLNEKQSILVVNRTRAKTWYFGCDKKHSPSDWKPTTLHQVFDLDETTTDISFLLPEFIAKRNAKHSEWKVDKL